MELGNTQREREVAAARNQSMFRHVNERIKDLNRSLASVSDVYEVACECADTSCVDTIAITPPEYAAIRENPRHFAVLPGHVYPDVERVVREADAYVVVEKLGAAGALAEELV